MRKRVPEELMIAVAKKNGEWDGSAVTNVQIKDKELAEAIDKWRLAQTVPPSRASVFRVAAARFLIEEGVLREDYNPGRD